MTLYTSPILRTAKRYYNVIVFPIMFLYTSFVGVILLSMFKQLQVEKLKGEILGVVIVESGWGSILPTVILANMMNGGPAARSGKLSIGDQIMSINGTSLVGLPLATCQGIIKVSHISVKRDWKVTLCKYFQRSLKKT